MKNKHYNKPTRSASIMKLEHIIVTVAVVSLLVGIPAGLMFSGKAKTLESQILQRKELERSIEQVNQELDAKSHDVNSKVEDIQRLEREKQELEAKLQARLQSKREVVVARAQAEAQVAVKTPPVAVSGGNIQEWLYKLRMCEAGGRYNANTGNGFYGAYQFMISTWNRIAVKTNRPNLVGVRPDLATPADQDAMIIDNTILSKGGLSSQNPGCFAKTGISNKPPL